MIYRFILVSDEVDNFKREIQINSDATFLDFHNEILKCTDYDKKGLYSFFICDDDWSKQTEITQIEMDTSSEEDNYIMESTRLEELVEDENQKLIYVFDPMTERCFFIELREIITGKNIKKPMCSKSVGKPPKQFVDFEKEATKNVSTDLGEDLYGDDEYDNEELEGLNEGSFDDDPDWRIG